MSRIGERFGFGSNAAVVETVKSINQSIWRISMVEWMRHKDGGKMWFRRDKSQAGGMIGVINVVFILQPAMQIKRDSRKLKETVVNWC